MSGTEGFEDRDSDAHLLKDFRQLIERGRALEVEIAAKVGDAEYVAACHKRSGAFAGNYRDYEGKASQAIDSLPQLDSLPTREGVAHFAAGQT